jgi:hypothetical protein
MASFPCARCGSREHQAVECSEALKHVRVVNVNGRRATLSPIFQRDMTELRKALAHPRAIVTVAPDGTPWLEEIQ